MTEAELTDALRDSMAGLGAVTRLKELGLDAGSLRTREMIAIAERALDLVSDFYVHLPTKRVLHATDPEQALRNLRAELASIDRRHPRTTSALDFHRRMTAIFVALRDRHTSYFLPATYRRTIAFLPFLVEAFVEDGERTFVVSKVFDAFAGAFEVAPGDVAVVTHWNGVPIERAVTLNGDCNAGANPAARFARGLDRLTFRWLGSTPEPDEDWVDVTYTADGEQREQRFEWLAVQRPEDDSGPAPAAGGSFSVGRDDEGEWIRKVKERLFARDKWERRGSSRRLAYRRHPANGGRRPVGYLRIYSFDVDSPDEEDEFVESVRKILRRAPQRGLIIDIRGNPGGSISAAERLLPLFSPGQVEVENLQFRNTPEAAQLAKNHYASVGLGMHFADKLHEAQSTGSAYISSLPLTQLGARPVPDQVYQGPVVLIVDALCYSASDIFAAGMQDNGLATIVGTAGQTGAGGANVWDEGQIWETFGRQAAATAVGDGATFGVAVRRTTRVRERAGVALEDVGVVVMPGNIRPPTRADVLGNNDDLLDFAVQRLDEQQHYRLRASFDGQRAFRLSTRGVDRVDVYFDDRPFASEREPNGKAIDVAVLDPQPTTALFLGYADGAQPVTSFRWVRPGASNGAGGDAAVTSPQPGGGRAASA